MLKVKFFFVVSSLSFQHCIVLNVQSFAISMLHLFCFVFSEKSDIPSFQRFYVFLLICIGAVTFLLKSDISYLLKIWRALQGAFGNLLIKRNRTYFILLYAKPSWMKVNTIMKGKYRCEFQNCQISAHKVYKDYNKSDVILFYHDNMGIKPPKKFLVNLDFCFYRITSVYQQTLQKERAAMSFRLDSQLQK